MSIVEVRMPNWTDLDAFRILESLQAATGLRIEVASDWWLEGKGSQQFFPKKRYVRTERKAERRRKKLNHEILETREKILKMKTENFGKLWKHGRLRMVKTR